MPASTDGRIAVKTVRSRPSWLRALGEESPPEQLQIAGARHTLSEVYKHDSWAATALYRGPDGTPRIVKIHRKAPLLFIPMRWLGRRTARNERRLLETLAGLDGIPALAGEVDQGGPAMDNAVAREFVPGHPLGAREAVPDSFFPALQSLLDAMHARRTVYVDLHKRENVIVGDGSQPCLIDFQISLLWPSWLPRGALFRIFSRSDDYHLMKHWARCRPDQCGVDTAALQRRIPWWIRAHRLVARPFRELRRRILVLVGVRSGKGRVETEAFAEHALRDITQPRSGAA
ncbi:hypothetical protein [Aquisphaera insulae]|uniref:hypothetical protein n=1 Tax=Aquisphaera insulae TaxID=2712864 RepID=UPI0013EC6D96|nr:hypothetical protein [Aquisphaera insulae]